MKKNLLIGATLVVTNALANNNGSERSAKTKQDVPLEYKCCKATYDEIREQLQEGAITMEEAQKLWLEHKENER